MGCAVQRESKIWIGAPAGKDKKYNHNGHNGTQWKKKASVFPIVFYCVYCGSKRNYFQSAGMLA